MRSGDGRNGYRPAWWLRNAHAQTVWGKFARRIPAVETRSELIAAPDGEDIEVHHVDSASDAPRLLLLHGLEGSRNSHYVGGLLARARARGWGASLLVFRGCGSAPNLARRFYHSGETTDLDAVFATLSRRWPESSWHMAGVSLGGNVLLKWLAELGDSVSPAVRAAAVVSVPFDLEAGARQISRGFARVYDRSFLKSLRRKAIAKLSRYPGLFDVDRLARARNVFEFDDAVTASVHGFMDARDYYRKSSSLGFLRAVRLPTLLLSARDDPFLPPVILDAAASIAQENPALRAEFHRSGGHAGFVGGAWPWRPFYYSEWRVFRFFDEVLEGESSYGYD